MVPEGIIREDTPASRNLSTNDVLEYASILTQLALFMPAMQSCKKYNPDPTASLDNMVRGFGFLQKNKDMLIEITRFASTTSLTTVTDHPTEAGHKIKSIRFEGYNQAISLFADTDGKFYHSCSILEESPGEKRTFIDLGCNGSVDYGRNGDAEPRHIDSILNAESYWSLLLDLRRFVQAAHVAFPRE
jgi:hypothetical protein